MTALLTTAGSAWLADILAGTTPANVFTALELGAGNNVPAVSDTRASMTAKIGGSLIDVAAGYPILGDSDLRNDGRGVSTYTWKWVYPEGATALIASNAIVTNFAAGAPSGSEPVLVSAAEVLVKRADQVLTVFVNLTTGGTASLVAHVEDGEPLVEQMTTWRQESMALSGMPGATPVSNGVVRSRLSEGEQAWIGAAMTDGRGDVLTSAGVSSVLLVAMRRVGEREWAVGQEIPLEVGSVMATAPVQTDRRWRSSQGYTFAHAWVPPGNWGARKTRLEYTLTLLSGETRSLVHEIEWASIRTK
jgi:hypothetical protein